jgi:tetratricopeptide (TPR) repeat protein
VDHTPLRINPLSYTVRRAYLVSLEPQWGGSAEQMARFAQEAQAHAARNPRLALLKGFVAAHVDAPEAVREKDQPRALRHYDEALAYGEDAGFLKGRAQTLAALGRHREAIDHCTRVLEIWPHNLMALRLRAEYRHPLGQAEDALADIALGLSFDATDEDLLAFRAWAQDRAGKHEMSLADYDAALQARPNSPSLWAGKGVLLVDRLDRLDEGRQACQKALELDAEEAEAWLCLGLAQARNADRDGSRASFARSLALSRESAAYTRLGYRYREGRGVVKDLGEAARLFEEGAQRGDVLAQTNAGFHSMNGDGVPRDYAKAARWFEAAARAGDADARRRLPELRGQMSPSQVQEAETQAAGAGS